MSSNAISRCSISLTSKSSVDSPTHWNTKQKWNNLHLELMSYTLKYNKKVKQSASRIDSPTHWNTKRKWNNLHLELTVQHTEIQNESETICI